MLYSAFSVMICLPLARWILTRAPCSSSIGSIAADLLAQAQGDAVLAQVVGQRLDDLARPRTGSSRGRLSISVTRTPSAAKMLAYSQPITPAPTTVSVRGSFSSRRMSSLVKIALAVERDVARPGSLRCRRRSR